jgi:hypothetical protein
MTEQDWDNLERIFKQARLAYFAGDDGRFHALAYMLQVSVNNFKDAYLGQPTRGGFIYPAGIAEIQTETVRADRGADRPSDPT